MPKHAGEMVHPKGLRRKSASRVRSLSTVPSLVLQLHNPTFCPMCKGGHPSPPEPSHDEAAARLLEEALRRWFGLWCRCVNIPLPRAFPHTGNCADASIVVVMAASAITTVKYSNHDHHGNGKEHSLGTLLGAEMPTVGTADAAGAGALCADGPAQHRGRAWLPCGYNFKPKSRLALARCPQPASSMSFYPAF